MQSRRVLPHPRHHYFAMQSGGILPHPRQSYRVHHLTHAYLVQLLTQSLSQSLSLYRRTQTIRIHLGRYPKRVCHSC